MTTEVYMTDAEADEIPPERRHLAHPGDHPGIPSPWPPTVTLCGDPIGPGMSYREVGYADLNPNLECCDRCDFALFVERNEEIFARFADEVAS